MSAFGPLELIVVPAYILLIFGAEKLYRVPGIPRKSGTNKPFNRRSWFSLH